MTENTFCTHTRNISLLENCEKQNNETTNTLVGHSITIVNVKLIRK